MGIRKDQIPSDAELIIEAFALLERLRLITPSPDFPIPTIEKLSDILDEIIGELRGERTRHITLFRPVSLASYVRNNYDSTLDTVEGEDVFQFIRSLAYRAEALDLPRWEPPKEA